MLQLIFMVVGIVSAFKLMGVGNAGAKLGLSPEALAEWRHHRVRQYVWRIVAGWGSAVVGLMVGAVAIDSNGQVLHLGNSVGAYHAHVFLTAMITARDFIAQAEDIGILESLAGLAVLIVSLVLSSRAGRDAKALEHYYAASRVAAPS